MAGSVETDPDHSIAFDETTYKGDVDVPDNRRLSLTQAWDDFNNRSVASGWGTSSGGDAWTAQVSGAQYWSVNSTTGYGVLNPNNISGTFQIGLPVAMFNGDTQIRASWNTLASGGTLQPLTIVIRRIDNNNYVRAALEELATDNSLHLTIYKTVAGNTTQLATQVVLDPNGRQYIYTPGDWYYLRFQFNGNTLNARAWKMDSVHTGSPPNCNGTTNQCPVSYEPTTWLTATDSAPQSGTVSIRSANSLGTTRPTVSFDSFWLQTLGFTVHYTARITSLEQVGDGSSEHTNDILGKGASHNTSDHEAEYEARYLPINTAAGPTLQYVCVSCLKFYVFNIDGALGAGTAYPDLACDANGYNCTAAQPALQTGTWYDIVAELDSGDYLDKNAAVTMYVNGTLWQDATHRCSGNLYDGLNCNLPGYPEWQIVPVSGTRSLKIGTFDTYEHWFGGVDEVAIFDHKLSPTDVSNLYSALISP